MKKREADFGIQFRSWIRSQKGMESAAFELKQTTKDSIPFSDLKEHQENALLAASSSGILYKAPDDSRGVKPFDYFYLRQSPAYVFIRFPDGFVGISIDKFIKERARSKRKSLTYTRAAQIADFIE